MGDALIMDKFLADLIRDEDIRDVVYDDATGKPLQPGDKLIGYATIGIGHNLHEPLSEKIILLLAEERANTARMECEIAFDFWDDLSERRKRALANMCFNLGLTRLRRFKKMLLALENGYYDQAADEALDSVWADQVGDRALRIAQAFREG